MTVTLELYAGLFALAASVADTSSTGGLVFLFVPLYGFIGLLAILVFIIGGEAVVEFWRGWRQRPS